MRKTSTNGDRKNYAAAVDHDITSQFAPSGACHHKQPRAEMAEKW